jgi:hypothetical protein
LSHRRRRRQNGQHNKFCFHGASPGRRCGGVALSLQPSCARQSLGQTLLQISLSLCGIFHVEYMIEDLGHIFAGSLGSFCELKAAIDELEIDCALIDVDLSDGPTGPAAAEWLLQLGIPSIFVTAQEQTAAKLDSISLGTVGKPLTLPLLAENARPLREIYKIETLTIADPSWRCPAGSTESCSGSVSIIVMVLWAS